MVQAEKTKIINFMKDNFVRPHHKETDAMDLSFDRGERLYILVLMAKESIITSLLLSCTCLVLKAATSIGLLSVHCPMIAPGLGSIQIISIFAIWD